jgi:hypothetical protein
MLKTFKLYREQDVSGISGCGYVAEGCVFQDKESEEVVIRWFGEHSSINIYHSVNDIIYLHGHQNRTSIKWD